MTTKTIKLDSFIWIAENGSMEYGVYIGDGDDPVTFKSTLKEVVRQTLDMYFVGGVICPDHRGDVEQLIKSLKAATALAEHELERIGNDS
jgi:hypothetical protein